MSAQAIETDDDIIIDEGTEEIEDLNVSQETEEPETEEEETEPEGEVEIVLEGEEEPSSKPAKSRYAKRIDKLNGKIHEAKSETEAERQRREFLEEQNKLLRKQLEKQDTSDKAPNPDDFETTEDFESAKADYDEKRFKELARQEAERLFEESQSNTTQAQINAAKDAAMTEHYERAEAANIPNYEALEDAAIEVMGKELVSEIMVNTDRSHIVLAHLGMEKNREKAERFAQLVKTSPVKCLLEIGALAKDLKVQRRHSPAADPETTIDKGIAATESPFLNGVRFE